MCYSTVRSGRALSALVMTVLAGALAACGTGSSSSASAAPPSAKASSSQPGIAPGEPSPGGGSPSKASKGSLAGKVIVVDPGHNGGNAKHPEIINKKVNVYNGWKACNTTGTSTDDNYSEHEFTWDVANRLAKILRAKGAKVVMTRSNDTGVGPCVDERARIGNRAHADAVLAIHGDGAPAKGHGFHIIEPAVIKGHNESIIAPSKQLGGDMRDAFHQGTGIPFSTYLGKNGIDVRSDLGGLNVSTRPAVFIECGNMRNPGDAAKMKSPQGRQQMAEALANGFVKYLG
ncbi:N-acetylmuramoyl-L-alanine amidase [Actinoallomurus sp. NPDC050550]|uniref:N-acetylmuramoyl-L-alanine amidase n=1 Tax=Actinoallomurus sp. NPDC050550 TaxID=3154937 RepID=UPI0033FB289E